MIRKTKLTIVISAYNEAMNLPECLDSVKWADEIIVVDNTSWDNTVEIAKKHKAKVFTRPNNTMLNINKNFGFSKATNEWILNLDADERVAPALHEEIIKELQENIRYAGYKIPRKNILFGKWIKSEMWWPDYQIRLFKKSLGRFPEKHVHELIVVDGEVGVLSESILHLNYTSISQFLQKMDKIYTENEAENILTSGRKLSWIDAVQFPANDFLKTFFMQKGYKDGVHGLVLSLLQAFYMVVVFAKVWEKQGFFDDTPKSFMKAFYRVLKKIGKDTSYWYASLMFDETKSPVKKFFYRFKRKRSS